MYQHIIPIRILFSVGIGLLIFSLVFGWVAFSVPDWLQFYENNQLKNQTSTNENFQELKKIGLWYKCSFLVDSNDFSCTSWNNDTPSFVRIAQVLVSMGLSFGCLAFLLACIAVLCRRIFISTTLFAGLFAFLSFVFVTIGLVVFATESLVYVDRLQITNNTNPRRWGMWLLIPNLVLSFLTAICFFLSSIINWCDNRAMKVTGILNHSMDKFDGSVSKFPSDNNSVPFKKLNQYPEYPTTSYPLNGLSNNKNNPPNQPISYPPPPSYTNQGYQPTPPGLFGYSRAGSPTMNPMYPYTNYDLYHPRHFMTENSEMDEYPRSTRSHRRSRSRSHSHSRHRRSNYRSRSYSSDATSPSPEPNQKQTQFVPISIPYYQPQPSQSIPNNKSQPLSYMLPQLKQALIDANTQPTTRTTNMIKYSNGQPSVVIPNPTQPVYTIAYRPNTSGNIVTGPPAATYVTASRNQFKGINSFDSESDNDEKYAKFISKPGSLKKININQAWAWRKMQ